MVRIHDTLDAATSGPGTTSHTTQQNELTDQAAFDQHLDEIPLELEQQAGVGSSHPVVSGDPEDNQT
ncbi:hypothetical protein [Bradyrhizobium sp. USDA 3315]